MKKLKLTRQGTLTDLTKAGPDQIAGHDIHFLRFDEFRLFVQEAYNSTDEGGNKIIKIKLYIAIGEPEIRRGLQLKKTKVSGLR
jgi:hypothetical protein